MGHLPQHDLLYEEVGKRQTCYTGVTIQVTKKQGMDPNLLRKTIAHKWQTLNIHTGGLLF
jgi:hypothetical protein